MSPAMIAAAGLGLVTVTACVRHAARRVGMMALIWRWLSGHPWHGQAPTNATWLHRADKVTHPSGRAGRWHHLPRSVRAAIRTGMTGAALATVVGWYAARSVTLHALAGLAVLAVLGGLWLTVRAARAWQHDRAWTRPLHAALAPALGVPAVTRPRSWLTVPRDFAKNDQAEIRVNLPDRFRGSAEEKRVILQTVQAKLGLEDIRPAWHTTGPAPFLTVSTSIPPPDRVTLASVRDMLASLPETSPLIGLGRKSVPVPLDLAADSPHCLISGGSGSGKSVLARFLMAQAMRNGGIILVLDIKRISHRWARGLPGVYYCRTIAEIHDALIWAQSEGDRRNEIVDTCADENGDLPADIDLGPRFWMVCEEMNATAARLSAYWRKIKAKEDPAVSPAVEALGDFVFMGRAVKMNAIAIAQMMTAKALGGPEARENFAFRCLARYSLNAWKMLCPEVWPMPRMSRHSGRWQIVTGGEARETQVGFMSAPEARAWAMSGTVATFPDMTGAEGQAAALTASQGLTGSPELGNRAVSLTGPALRLVGPSEPVGLREACESGTLTVSLDTARWARANDPEFPPARGKEGQEFLYFPGELRAWEGNRERSGQAAGSEG